MYKAISYTLIFLGIQLLISGLTAFGLQFTGHEDIQQSPYVLIISMLVSSLLTMGIFLHFGWAQASRAYMLSRPWIVIAWSVTAAIGTVIPSTVLQENMPQLPNLVEQELGSIMNTPGGYFIICLLVPLAEELVFRGAVLRALLAWRPQQCWAMIAVSSLLFALSHMNPAQMPHAFLIGLLLGWMYKRTGSIVPGVAFHWANNTIAYIVFRLYPNPDLQLIDILGSQRHVAAAVGFSLFILLPSLYQLHLWMKRAE